MLHRASTLLTKRTTPHRKFSKMSNLKYPSPLVLKAKTPSAGTVIFLHGLGDSGHGWLDGMEAVQQLVPNVKFILPNAPSRPITCNGGYVMPGWYDIIELGSKKSKEDEEGLEVSKKYVLDLVKEEIAAGTPADKIVVGGFSQGAAVTLYTVYSADIKLAGALAMSGYLPLSSKIQERFDKTNQATPLLQCHGLQDSVVPHEWGKLSFDALQTLSVPGNFKSYKSLAHSASIAELQDVANWIKTILPEPKL